MGLGRKLDKRKGREQRDFVRGFPEVLTLIPREEYPVLPELPLKAWRSRKYIVQLYETWNIVYPGLLRLSVTRTQLQTNGRLKDGITWDELQAIKREIGYGEFYAVEVFPPDRDIINVANVRHLWILPTPLPIGWTYGETI